MGITIGEGQAKSLLQKGMAEAEELIKEPSKVDELLIQFENALKNVPLAGEILSDIPLMIAMVKASIKKEYAGASPKVIACLAGSFLYFVKGNDLVPDSLPVIGIADDVAVLALALKLCKPELDAFAQWRDNNYRN